MVYLDPFTEIVGVSWAAKGKMASLQFQSTWQNGEPNPNNFSVTLQELGLSFNIYDNVVLRETPDGPILARSIGPYRHNEFEGDLDSDISVTYYHYQFTGPSAFADNWFSVTTITNNNGTTESWQHVSDPPAFTPSGGGGPGGQAAIVEAVLSGGAFDTATLIETNGPHTSHHTGDPHVLGIDNAVIIFNLSAIRAALPPVDPEDSNPLTITFSTGVGPATVHDPDHVGIIGYVWISTFDAYEEVGYGDFTVDEFNLPVNWPDAVFNEEEFRVYESEEVQPTPSTDVTYRIELVSLELF